MFRSRLALVALLCAALSGTHLAFAAEQLDSDRPEAWAMFYFTSVSMFSGLGTPRSRPLGSVEAGLELGSIPHLDDDQRKVGFNGVKEEDLNKAPIFARGRLTVGLPWKLAIILGYVPPVEVFGLRAHLFAYGLERPLYERGPWTFGLRAYGQVGYVEGAFTCPGDVADKPPGSPGNPYGCEGKSKDKATQTYWGAELSGSYRLDVLGGATPWLTIAGNYLDTQFDVKATTFGFRDRSRLKSDTGTVTFGLGVRYPITEKIEMSIGGSYTPLWVVRPPSTGEEQDGLLNARTTLSYRFL